MSNFRNDFGLPGREDFLKACDSQANIDSYFSVIVVIDAEDLREIETLFGQATSAVVRRRVAGRLKAGLPTIGNVAVLGEDRLAMQFLVESEDEAKSNSERLHRMLESSFSLESDQEVEFVFNLGAAVSRYEKADTEEVSCRDWSTALLASAEAAMHAARRDPSLGLVVAEKLTVKSMARRLHIERILAGSPPLEEMYLEYQPVVHLITGKIIGEEALLRWRNTQLGEIEPFLLLEILADRRPALSLAKWTIDQLIDQSISFSSEVCLNLNVSPELLFSRDRRLLDYLLAVARENILKVRIHLEFPPKILAWSKDRVIGVMSMLREAGYGLTMDDVTVRELGSIFLKSLPLEEMKISRNIASMLLSHKEISRAVQSIASFQEGRLVVKGVENEQIAQALIDLGVSYGQGYYLGRPRQIISQ